MSARPAALVVSRRNPRGRPRRTASRRGRGAGGESDLRTVGGVQARRRDSRVSSVSIGRGVQFMPDEYRCYAAIDYQTFIGSGATGSTYTVKLNAPFNLFGPQVNYTGAFPNNVPAGSNAIISSNATAGATPPYNLATVTAVDFELTALTSNATTPNASAFNFAAFPSLNISASGMASSVFREQPMCTYMLCPAVATEPLKLVGHIDLATVFGVSKRELANNLDYAHPVGADPQNICYHQIQVNSLDGVSAVNVTIISRYVLHFIFRRRNQINSTAPT